jgi:hypothetical protein
VARPPTGGRDRRPKSRCRGAESRSASRPASARSGGRRRKSTRSRRTSGYPSARSRPRCCGGSTPARRSADRRRPRPSQRVPLTRWGCTSTRDGPQLVRATEPVIMQFRASTVLPAADLARATSDLRGQLRLAIAAATTGSRTWTPSSSMTPPRSPDRQAGAGPLHRDGPDPAVPHLTAHARSTALRRQPARRATSGMRHGGMLRPHSTRRVSKFAPTTETSQGVPSSAVEGLP